MIRSTLCTGVTEKMYSSMQTAIEELEKRKGLLNSKLKSTLLECLTNSKNKTPKTLFKIKR